jgi:hypothetical protein
MHDLDRTQLEAYEAEDEFGELEEESEEFLGALIGPATQILGGLLGGGRELEAPFSEMETLELANELLEVQSEEELEDFLGDIIKKAGSAVGSFVRSDTGKALTGVAKDVAKQALPSIGQAVGGYFGGPTGAQLGGKAASWASSLLGLELEGLSAQEAELEAAKGVVRMTGAAAKVAAQAPRNAPPKQVAKAATQAAAQRYAPGLVTGRGGTRQQRQPRAQSRRRRPQRRRGNGGGPASQIAVASGLPPWIADEPYGGDGYEPNYGDGNEPDYNDGYDQPRRGGRSASSGRWVRRRGQIVLLGI